LAYEAYSQAKLYALDLPLSSMDMYIGQQTFKFCIKELIIGCGGTIVLEAIHQTELAIQHVKPFVGDAR